MSAASGRLGAGPPSPGSGEPQRPPRVGRAMWKRFGSGIALIVLLVAATTATAILLQVKDAVTAFESVSRPLAPDVKNVLDDVATGKPQTILVVGSDARYVDRRDRLPVRSDTMLVVRLDPDRNASAIMSIPRDLKVPIPGYGTDKINAAFAIGGPKLMIRTVRDLLGIPIHHVVTVQFRGFRGAVNKLGCIYTDVDRRYFNDNDPPSDSFEKYATIDIKPGYQKLCGSDALDYVRYRHLDDDFVRAARQQDFLGQAKEQIGVGRLFGDREELLKIFGRYTQTDIRGEGAVLRLLKLAYDSSKNPLVHVNFRAGQADNPEYVEVTPENLTRTVDEFLSVRASPGPRPSRPGSTSERSERRSSRRGSGGLAPGLTMAKTEGENHVLDVQTRLRFPVYFPAVRLTKGGYADGSPRAYDIYDRSRDRYRAYRVVLAQGDPGQYYGVQGTTWRSPPILDNPSETRRMRGRDYELFYDGSRLRLVAWRTAKAVYWVSNTLNSRLTNSQMLDIARSLQRIGQ